MDSFQSFASSINAVDRFYPEVSAEAEILHRPKQDQAGISQSSFFALLTKLDVPIMGRARNRDIQDTVFVGQGTSYFVTQALIILTGGSQGFLNRRKLANNKLEGALVPKAFVMKRIVPSPSQATNDHHQLAAIANEIRILANESVRNAHFITSMLGVGWDEVPTAGRYWPRLLIEAADYGTLGDFLTISSDATNVVVRVQLLLDVLEGLRLIHAEGIAHCDLKLENILIFQHNVDKNVEFPIKYRAKLCDFGFAVNQRDYTPHSSFCGRLGTEPWNAPELMGETEVNIRDLPKADIYSFGFVVGRVMAQGLAPFKDISPDDLRERKRREDDNEVELTIFDTVLLWIVALDILVENERNSVVAILQSTLALKPQDRSSIPKLAILLMNLEGLARRRIRSESLQSKNELPDLTEPPHELSPRPETFIRRILGRIFTIASALLIRPARWMFRKFQAGFNRLASSVSAIIHEASDALDIAKKRLDLLTNFDEPSDGLHDVWSSLPNIIELEMQLEFNRMELPDPVSKELHRDLLEQAQNNNTNETHDRAEASYQLAVAHFEGIGAVKNRDQSFSWLKKAIELGSGKSSAAAHNISLSFDLPIPEYVRAGVEMNLARHAENELHGSLLDTIQNKQHMSEEFPSLRLWSTQNPTAYRDYLQSPLLNEVKTVILSASLVLEDYNASYEPFDFQVLAGYDAHGDPHFDVSQKSQFINAVRWHKCVESIGTSRLTLLQVAALMGDVQMAEVLLVDLHADVNAVGGTPGYSPLWISCLNGHIDAAFLLLRHGAEVNVKDAREGRSILHFLNRFQTQEDVGQVLQIGLQAGLDTDEKDLRGNTPLLATFIGWDFSYGVATRLLLDAGADPLVLSNSNFSAVRGGLKTLDSELLVSLFQHSAEYHKNDVQDSALSTNPIERAKALAFNILSSHIEFYCRRVCGKDVTTRIKEIVDVILYDNISSTFLSMGLIEESTNPLIISAYMGQNMLLKVIINSPLCPILDEVDSHGMTAIHWCAERGNLDGAISLLQAGADPLIFDNKGSNMFHVAAKFAPEFLVQIFEAIEAQPMPRLEGRSGQNLLGILTQDKEATPFILAVMEGAPEHLKCADTLRTRYHLDHDAYQIPSMRVFYGHDNESKMTTAAYITGASVVTNMMTLSQAEYVLGLRPKPKFRADTSGKTLLHFAVSGMYHANISSNSSGYAVLQLILRAYPGQAHIEQPDDEGNTPIHSAAAASNITALEIMQSHLSSRNEHFNVNLLNNKGETSLDVLGHMEPFVRNLNNEYMSKIFGERTNATQEFLVNLGASYGTGKVEEADARGVVEVVKEGPVRENFGDLPDGIIERVDEAWLNTRLDGYGLDMRGLLNLGPNRILLQGNAGGDVEDS